MKEIIFKQASMKKLLLLSLMLGLIVPLSAPAIVQADKDKTDDIKLVVIDPDVAGCVELQGSPLVGKTVILKQPNEFNQTTQTDANGCYEFPDAVPGKTFKVLIKGPVAP